MKPRPTTRPRDVTMDRQAFNIALATQVRRKLERPGRRPEGTTLAIRLALRSLPDLNAWFPPKPAEMHRLTYERRHEGTERIALARRALPRRMRHCWERTVARGHVTCDALPSSVTWAVGL